MRRHRYQPMRVLASRRVTRRHWPLKGGSRWRPSSIAPPHDAACPHRRSFVRSSAPFMPTTFEHRRDAACAVRERRSSSPPSSWAANSPDCRRRNRCWLRYALPSPEDQLHIMSARMRIGFIEHRSGERACSVTPSGGSPANAVDLTIVGDRDESEDATLAQRATGLCESPFTGRVPHQEIGRHQPTRCPSWFVTVRKARRWSSMRRSRPVFRPSVQILAESLIQFSTT